MIEVKELSKRMKPFSLVEMERETGLTYQYLWQLRKGKRPNPSYITVKKIVDYMESCR